MLQLFAHRKSLLSNGFVICVLFAAMSSFASATATGTAGGFLELTAVFFGEGDRTFGPNEVITASGAVPFIPSFLCPGIAVHNKGRGEGRFDFFPVADLYVIPDNGKRLFGGMQLTDVNGTPNRVTGLSGGVFVEEAVGIAKPSGALPAGRYDIVMDQCLDSIYDPIVDIVVGDGMGYAFEVVVPEGLGSIDLHPIKKQAKLFEKILAGDEIETPLSKIEIPGFCATFKKQVEKAKLTDRAPILASWAGIAITRCIDLTKHWGAIAADPPDPSFREFAELRDLHYAFGATASPLERAMRNLAHTLAEQTEQTRALLVSLERFQGAQQAGDDEYTALQLQEVNKYMNLLGGGGGSLLRFYAALEFYDRALQQDESAGLPETAELRALMGDVRRSIGGLLRSFSSDFRRVPRGDGQDDLVPDGLGAWITVYLGTNPHLGQLGLPSINDVRVARGLPPLVFQHPTAATDGPYAVAPGRLLNLSGIPSSDPNGDPLSYAWDIDGDGAFDDYTGAQIIHTFEHSGTRLVGLKVSDPAGNTDVAYVTVRVGDIAAQDIIAISQRQSLLRVSSSGAITTLREALPINAHVNGLRVEPDGSIWVLDRRVIRKYDAEGVLLKTITLADVGALLGFNVKEFLSFVFDGKADMILSLQENLGPGMHNFLDFPYFNRFDGALGGRVKVVRLSPDATRASAIADVDQNFLRTYVTPDGTRVVEDYAGRSGGSHQAALAIDNDGNIIVASVNNLLYPYYGTAVFKLDPTTGTMTEIIVDETTNGPSALPPLEYRQSGTAFGGVRVGNQRIIIDLHPGLEVDENGDFITGWGSSVGSSLRLFRILMPPQVTKNLIPGTIVYQYLYETFPVSLSGSGLPYLIVQDIAIDSGGDYLVAASDFGGVLGPSGIFRVSPVGEISRVIQAPIPAGGFGADLDNLDVVREERKVTPRDVLAAPKVHLESMQIEQMGCPANAELSLTVRNTGASDSNDPIRVFFFDGDPEADGRLIGMPTLQDGLPTGSSAVVNLTWPNPNPGVHEVFAMTFGSENIAARASMICLPDAFSSSFTLTPATATLNVGTQHTVQAMILDLLGSGLPGVKIAFTVSGANPKSSTVLTDAAGVAKFTYTGAAAGEDNIAASVVEDEVKASVTWEGAANRPPVANAGADQSVEATSPTGASITLTGGGSDPDGDPLEFTWTGPFGSLGGASISPTLPLGMHALILRVSDGSLSASDEVKIAVVDTTPPVVTPPSAIAVPATEAGGARGIASTVLAGFLLSGSAVDVVDLSPTRLTPQVSGIDANNNTLFPLGTTPVTFRFTDAAGNIGTVAANVTVAVGTPRLSGKVIAKGRNASGVYFVDLQLTDTGTGHARNVKITQLPLKTLSGSGTVSYNTALSPALPLTIGSLDAGTSTTIRLYLNVPATVTKFSITENGTVQDVVGTTFNYSTGQGVIP